MTTTVSAEHPDWSREAIAGYVPSRQLLRAIRDYQRIAASGSALSPLTRRLAVVRYRFWSAVTGADIPLDTRLGGGLVLPHPVGVVFHPAVRLGPNCMIFQNVTLGTGGKKDGVPTLGGHVDVGAGAQILGGVTIGDHATIGANAVVLTDIPAGAVAVGVPARIIDRGTALAEPSAHPKQDG